VLFAMTWQVGIRFIVVKEVGKGGIIENTKIAKREYAEGRRDGWLIGAG